ncbi:MAG: hypothetical protein ABIJ97_03630 [Bacteroidota bacterium]
MLRVVVIIAILILSAVSYGNDFVKLAWYDPYVVDNKIEDTSFVSSYDYNLIDSVGINLIVGASDQYPQNAWVAHSLLWED